MIYCTQERWELDFVLKHYLLNSLYLLEHIIGFGFLQQSYKHQTVPFFQALADHLPKLMPKVKLSSSSGFTQMSTQHPDERYLVLGITGQHRLANRSPDLSRTLDASFQYSTSNPCGVRHR